MAIALKNLLLLAEESNSITVNHLDGTTSTLPFEQRSFGYGQGGGPIGFDSQPPFIITDLPPVGSESTGYVLEDPDTLDVVDDLSSNFVRGGAVTLGKRALKDLERFTKVIFSPSGLAWTAAQLALSATNPKGPIPEADPAAASDPDKGGLIQGAQENLQKLKNKFPRNQVTLPIGTGLTIGTGAAGIRFRKDGLADLTVESGHSYDPSNGGAKYYNITVNNAKNISEKAKESNKNYNRLLNIYGKHILDLDLEPSIGSVKVDSKKRKDSANAFLLEYGGGAHSLFGIGRTAIKKYKSNPYDKSIEPTSGYLPAFNSGFFSLRQGSNTTKADVGRGNYTDYKTYGKDHKGENYKHKVKSTRIDLYKLGDPGRKPTPTTPGDPGNSYRVYDSKTIDKISAANIFKRQGLERIDDEFKDYIKFRIAVVDTENPLNDNVILFRALLDNVSDSFSGEWNSFKYNGRAEKFYTYGGFDRSISFGFKIHAQTRWEQKPLWRKLNYLVAQTAPEYKNRRMRGVFSRLTIGDWMNEIPGFFTSVNLSWNTAYPWEIRHDVKINEEGETVGTDRNINEYPHILDVSCKFQPVHNFAPNNSPSTPFLLPEIGVEDARMYAKQSDDELIINRYENQAGNSFTDGVAKDKKSAYYDRSEALNDETKQWELEEEAALEAEDAAFDDEFLDEEFNLDLT